MLGLYFSTSNLSLCESANSINVLNQSKALSKKLEKLTVIHFGNNFSEKYCGNILFVSCGSYNLINIFKAFYFVSQTCYNFIYTRSKVFAILGLAFFKTKINYEIHDVPNTMLGRFIEFTMLSIFKRRINIIFITNNLKEYYLRRFENINYKVLPDASNVVLEKSQIGIKIQNFISKPKLSVGYLGSSKKGKGMDFVYLLSEINKLFSFIIIGEDRKIKKEYLENENLNIIFKVSHEFGLNLLKDIDIALLPLGKSVMLNNTVDIGKYTSPLKLFEYWSAGCLVIISENPVLLDVCIPNFNCVVIEKLDELLWMDTLELIEKNRKLYTNIIENGYNHFCNNYTWDIRSSLILEFQNEK